MTFSPSLPTARDRVRLAVGDTGGTNAEDLLDATYDALLAIFPNERTCAVEAMRAIIARYKNQPSSRSAAGLSVSKRSMADLMDLYDRLVTAANAGAEGYAGGMDVSTVETLEGDLTLTQPFFSRDTHE